MDHAATRSQPDRAHRDERDGVHDEREHADDPAGRSRELPASGDAGLYPEAVLWVPPATFVSAVDAAQVVVWTGGLRQVVRGRSARLVSALLARARAGVVAGELVASVAADDSCAEDEVWAVVACLFDRGILDQREAVEERRELASDDHRSDELAAQQRYLSLFTSHPSRTEASIRSATIDVQAPSRFGSLVRDRLLSSGVGAVRLWDPDETSPVERASNADPGRNPAVLVGSSVTDEPMLARNDEWIAEGRAFLAVTLPSGTARVGPFVVPRESACLRCVAEAEERLRPALPAGLVLPKERPPAADLVPLLEVVAGVVALEIVKTLTGLFIPALANRRLFFEPSSLAFANEEVFKLTRCPACGRAARRVETEPFEMTSPPWSDAPATSIRSA